MRARPRGAACRRSLGRFAGEGLFRGWSLILEKLGVFRQPTGETRLRFLRKEVDRAEDLY